MRTFTVDTDEIGLMIALTSKLDPNDYPAYETKALIYKAKVIVDAGMQDGRYVLDFSFLAR